jgi:hypothetical protein
MTAGGRFEKHGKWISESAYEKSDPQKQEISGDLRTNIDTYKKPSRMRWLNWLM